MFFSIKTKAQVRRFTLLITAISVAVPVLVVGVIMSVIPGMPLNAILFGVSIAFFIPLLIAPPIAYLAMSMMHMLSLTIDKVDQHVKFDPLTGVLNRSHFLDSIRAQQCNGTLMIADADHFKSINDTRGHAAGDEALRILANTLEQSVGTAGIVARMGGEEFGIFLPRMDARAGQVMAEMLCSSVRNLNCDIGGKPLLLTISIGGTQHDRKRVLGQSLKHADGKLYAAKSAGRDRALVSDMPLPDEQRMAAA